MTRSTPSSGFWVYVAGSTSDVERVRLVQEMVRSRGWGITFDWTGPEGEIMSPAGSYDCDSPVGTWAAKPDKGADISTREIRACVTADLVVLLFPPSGKGLGCWIEMGAALAAGGAVWVVSPQRDSVFWQHPQVRLFRSFDDLARALALEAAA